jgi:ABC-2 type transport system ATP-binding protein
VRSTIGVSHIASPQNQEITETACANPKGTWASERRKCATRSGDFSNELIETENLTKKFGDLTAVDNVTMKVDDGEVFGFLGPNGAGKTTTVRMLCSLISKTSGEAQVGEFQVGKESDAVQIRKMVGLLPENVGLYEELSAYKNLDFYGKLYEVPEAQRKERIESILRLMELWDRRDDPAGTFSKGMKQKLAVGRALVNEPQLLFLDEPTANLDPEASKTVREFILELKKQKRTIFLNTHNLDEAQRVCDKVGILKTKLIRVGRPEELGEALLGRKVELQLVQVSREVLAAVGRLGLKATVDGNKLTVEVEDPARQNPALVEAVVQAGGRVQFVTELSASLEEIYLKVVKETQ